MSTGTPPNSPAKPSTNSSPSTQPFDGQNPKKGLSKWVSALLISIALNGVLIGLLLSGGLNNSFDKHRAGMLHTNATPPYRQQGRPNRLKDGDPRSLLRNLPRKRKKQLMESALKNLHLEKDKHPRRMFKQVHMAKRKARALLQADPLDTVALEAALARVRTLNQEIFKNGDALYIEILKNLTVEERLAIQNSMGAYKDKRPDQQERQNKMHRKEKKQKSQ